MKTITLKLTTTVTYDLENDSERLVKDLENLLLDSTVELAGNGGMTGELPATVSSWVSKIEQS
jgi:hypothetical protein